MNYLITGGNRGLGLKLCELFDGDSISRENGIDITKNVNEIAELSLKYDVFINNAFDGPPQESWANFGQVNVLLAVYEKWKLANKKGWIINIGSVGSKHVVALEPMFETYRISKSALEFASKQCTAAFKNNLVSFKTTLITLDRLDTPLTRSRESWTGNGISCIDIAEYIKFIISLSINTCIEETTFYVNFNYDSK
jgi:NADP-dependent 3-hydroxy acid dehydrogenase YdfG